MSTIRSKVLAAAASLTLLAGAGVAAAGSASASSAGCAFTNGCATLHGTDAASHAVAMDAKRQSSAPGTLIIGYPDIPGDGATSFDAVIHYTNGKKTTSYQDTGFTLSPTFTSVPCLLTTDPAVTPAGTPLTAGGNIMTVKSTTGTVTASPSSGSSIVLGGAGSLTIDEQYASDGTSCQAAYTGTVAQFTAGTEGAPDKAPLTIPTSPGGSIWTFLDSDTGGTFSFPGLPANVSWTPGGSLTADTSTAVPGTYSNVGVTYTATDGAVWTATFTLKVSGIKTVNPGPNIPYFTFVYAKGGVWSNECVTANNGSGGLVLQTCTLGKDQNQDFYALDGTGAKSAALQTSSAAFRIQNVIAAVTSAADSCLTDPSSLDPATPQTDAADVAASPAGRQLRADGSCTLGVNEWTWAS